MAPFDTQKHAHTANRWHLLCHNQLRIRISLKTSSSTQKDLSLCGLKQSSVDEKEINLTVSIFLPGVLTVVWVGHTHTQHVTLLPTELCHKYNTAFQFIYLIYKTLWYQYFVSAYWYIFYYMKITLFINCSDKCISIIRVCCKSVKTN